MAFITYEDLLDFLEDMVVEVSERAIKYGGPLLKELNPNFVSQPALSGSSPRWVCSAAIFVPVLTSVQCRFVLARQKAPKKPFRRMDYGDAIKYLQEHNIYKDEEKKEYYVWGDVCDRLVPPCPLAQTHTHSRPSVVC